MLEEDIDILISQTGIDRDLAKKLLIYKNGDLVESILEIEKIGLNNISELVNKIQDFKREHNNDDAEEEVDTSKKENLVKYRNIVDNKDTIYRKRKENNEKKKKEMLERQKALDNNEPIEETKMCNESIYYSTRKNNINNIKVL